MAQVPDHEGGEDHGPRDDPDQDPWVGPAMDGLLDDAVEQRGKARHGEQPANRVEGSRVRVLALRYEEPDAEQREDDDRRIDQEDGSPGVVGQQKAGEWRPEREAKEGPSRRGTDGAGTFLRREHAG